MQCREEHTQAAHTPHHTTHTAGSRAMGYTRPEAPDPATVLHTVPWGRGGPARASPVLCNPSSPEESPAQSVKDASVLTGSVRTSPFQAKKTDPSWAPDTIERGCGLMRLHQFRSAKRRKNLTIIPIPSPSPAVAVSGTRLSSFSCSLVVDVFLFFASSSSRQLMAE